MGTVVVGEDEQGGELPLKFEEIVDMYYDKMRPPKAEGYKLRFYVLL